MDNQNVINITLCVGISDYKHKFTKTVQCEPYMTYLIYRRQLQLLGMRLMVATARRRNMPITSYPCVQPRWVNPQECADLNYQTIAETHCKITTVYGDTGEIEVTYAKNESEERAGG